mmetsp:Transcript_17756/g.38927  ORF Transcript_17756/g.38927 Transcript_17756/m.38927 type:complete len:213 (+) Transcript_17756:2315-2953(+)
MLTLVPRLELKYLIPNRFERLLYALRLKRDGLGMWICPALDLADAVHVIAHHVKMMKAASLQDAHLKLLGSIRHDSLRLLRLLLRGAVGGLGIIPRLPLEGLLLLSVGSLLPLVCLSFDCLSLICLPLLGRSTLLIHSSQGHNAQDKLRIRQTDDLESSLHPIGVELLAGNLHFTLGLRAEHPLVIDRKLERLAYDPWTNLMDFIPNRLQSL